MVRFSFNEVSVAKLKVISFSDERKEGAFCQIEDFFQKIFF